jgi:PPM family protein phosphatase
MLKRAEDIHGLTAGYVPEAPSAFACNRLRRNSGTARTSSLPSARPEPRGRRFVFDFDDGSSVVIWGGGLIGREPVAPAGANVDQIVRVDDDTLSVSRTHLEFGIDESGLWVRDCFSTNGSQIETRGRLTRIESRRPVAVPPGSTIHIGQRRVRVRTIAGRTVIGDVAIDWGAATDAGAVRDRNEDAYCAEPPVFVVADGVGGHFAGELASRETVDALSMLAGRAIVTREMVEDRLADARARIGRIEAEGLSPATTVSGVVVTHDNGVPSWLVVNIGDSRTYRLNSDGFRQITVDHSLVQELVNSGALAPSSEAALSIRNVLSRALLAETEHPADFWLFPMTACERILVCSDGLTKDVEAHTIAGILRAVSDPLEAANKLVQLALDAGARDNVTALVVDALPEP